MKCPRYGIAQKCRGDTLELGGATLMVVAVQQKAQGDLEDSDLMWIRLQNEGRAYDAHRPHGETGAGIYCPGDR